MVIDQYNNTRTWLRVQAKKSPPVLCSLQISFITMPYQMLTGFWGFNENVLIMYFVKFANSGQILNPFEPRLLLFPANQPDSSDLTSHVHFLWSVFDIILVTEVQTRLLIGVKKTCIWSEQPDYSSNQNQHIAAPLLSPVRAQVESATPGLKVPISSPVHWRLFHWDLL